MSTSSSIRNIIHSFEDNYMLEKRKCPSFLKRNQDKNFNSTSNSMPKQNKPYSKVAVLRANVLIITENAAKPNKEDMV